MALPVESRAAPAAPVDEIDPFIGSVTSHPSSPGHGLGKTIPGPCTPYGLVQLGPDTITGGDNGSGYSYAHSTLEGFSFTHLSGVGWYGDFGNLQVMPQIGELVLGRDAAKSPFAKSSEKASAGYYAVHLDRGGIDVELTAAPRAGLIRFTFPAGPAPRPVLLKAGISFTSLAGAAAHLAADTPDWDFDALRQRTRATWSHALDAIHIEGGTPGQRQIFHTALYRTFIDPRAISDADGSFRATDGTLTRAEGYTQRTIFSGWDVFRSQFPLMTLIAPRVVDDTINSLEMPDWSFAGCNRLVDGTGDTVHSKSKSSQKVVAPKSSMPPQYWLMKSRPVSISPDFASALRT